MITLWLTFLLCSSVPQRFSVGSRWYVLWSRTKLWHQYSPLLCFYAIRSESNCLKCSRSLVLSCYFSNPSSPSFLLLAVLDVYVLSTDGQVQDFKFPQTSTEGISIQLSANTVKLNSRNGRLSLKCTEKQIKKEELAHDSSVNSKSNGVLIQWKHACSTFAPSALWEGKESSVLA